MTVRIVLCAILIAVIAYAAFEVRLWSRKPDLISANQRRIRGFGLFFLLLSLCLGLNGTYLRTPRTHGRPVTRATRIEALKWIGYWTLTVVSLVPIIPLALLDARENLRRASEQRRSILQEALSTTDGGSVEQPSAE